MVATPATLDDGRRSSSYSAPGTVFGDEGGRSRATVLALIVGITAMGAFAAKSMSRKSTIDRDEEAAEKAPLLARDYARIDIRTTA